MKKEEPVVVRQELQASPAEVWNAITVQSEMIQWFFEDIPDFKAEEGFKTRFNVSTPNHDFMHLWKITEVVPQRRIVYDWKYEGFPGVSVVTFEVEPGEEGAFLTVTHVNTESYPDDIVEFKRESCLGGWKYFISERLSSYLQSK